MALNKIDWTSYLECYRGLLIAPAGHGKTTAIADCIMQCPDDSCHLILTHTHAGIASLRVKLNKKKVPKNKYQIDTITSFAQRYVLSFEGNENLPKTEEKSYFSTVVQHCTKLLNSAAIQLVIKATYNGIFVDEYQDCTVEQHEMILSLAKNLPLHVLGDPLQGIFSFEKTPLVNFERELSDFQVYDCLKYPWRWHDTNEELGSQILSMRQCLETHKPILLDEISCNGLTVVHHSMPADLHNPSFLKLLRSTIKSNIDDSFLIIYPSFNEPLKNGQVQPRGSIKDRIDLKIAIDYGYNFHMIDAIDANKFYSCSKKIDEFIDSCQAKRKIQKIKALYDIMKAMHFGATAMNDWIDREHNRIKQKKSQECKVKCEKLQALLATFEDKPNLPNLMMVFGYVYSLTKNKCHFKELYFEIKHAADIAESDGISLYDAMTRTKNRIRHMGRKIEGRCIGTTLLTKGLEFDTVILYEAHKFVDEKNFYVAISRARKKLVIITSAPKIQFKI